MEQFRRRARAAWVSLSVLAVLCCGLATLQYRWIGEIAGAEQTRLHEELQARLDQLGRTFNRQLAAACFDLIPTAADIEQRGRQAAYAAQYLRWRGAHERVLHRVGIAVPEEGTLRLSILDLDTGRFAESDWPSEWSGMRDQLMQRLERRSPPAPSPSQDPALFEFPRFGPGGEQEWLVVELNLEYVRGYLLPELLRRYLGSDYQWELDENGAVSGRADATVALLQIPFARGAAPEGFGRWQLRVRHRAGSLQTLVARTRRRNLVISAAILLLILGAVSVLVRFSRQSQRLAELQMNFVAGVSHELRTPLTVIRTAAYNLRGRLAARPDQVERYGALIQDESEKLTALVEQVLRFASAKGGHVIRAREPVAVEEVIEDALRSSRASVEGAGLVVERRIDPGLPPVFADNLALQHALQNLLENALKYGTEASNWLGVFASAVENDKGRAVEIRIVDRGPGIPADEQRHIFNPFFRGRRAVQDQVHGTGLGLNLVKMIVEAHQGSIQVKSAPGQGTEFIVRIPAAEPEPDYEFSHSAD